MTKAVQISEEVLFIASRASSGIMNGSFYGKQWIFVGIGVILTFAFTYFSIEHHRDQFFRRLVFKSWPKWKKIVFISSFILALLSIGFTAASFAFPTWFFDIHAWTFLTQSFQSVCIFLNDPRNWWRMLLMVLPAVFFQKFFVNIFSGKPWWYNGTDTNTGKYWTMWGIKVPRLFAGNMTFRLIGTVVCLMTLYLTKKKK